MCIQESSEGKWRTEEAVMLKMVYTFYTHTHKQQIVGMWQDKGVWARSSEL